MATVQSRLTAQGQISVPAEIRRKLGVGPGSVLEWAEVGDEIVVRRAGTYSFKDIREAIFGDTLPKRKTLKEMKEGIARAVRKRHARS